MILRRTVILAILIVTATAIQAHDFWLIPDFAVRPGQVLRIMVHTGGRFPAGDSAVAADKIARFELYSARGKADVTRIKALEKATEAEAAIKEPGAYAIAVELKPELMELQAKEFNDYLTREGLKTVLELRSKTKKDDQPGKELCTRFAKSMVVVGDVTDETVARPVGMKLEIVPLRNPTSVRPGEKLAVRVLFDGKPLGNVQVAAVTDGFSKENVPDEDFSFTTRTSYEGIAQVPLLAPGNWLVRLVHMIPAETGKPHDWESFSATLTFRIPPERGFPLTVESIMRGADLVGYGIESLRWAGNSSRLYFGWRKPGERKSHTYVLSRADGALKRLSDEEAKSVPPPGGDYTKDRKKMVFAQDGDIVLQDTVANQRRILMRTVDTESSPRFTKDEKSVTFIRENNLYRLSLDSGEIVQLTDFRSTPRPPEPQLTDSQRFLEEQQKELFEVVRARAQDRAEAEARRKEREKRKPYYIPRGARISGLELSPDQTLAIFSQMEPAERSKSAVVPNYVTESGYTEDIPSRTKVGDAPGTSKMGLVSVETGDVTWIDHGQKDRVVGLSGPRWSEDGKNLIVTGMSQDTKDRWIFLVDPKSGKTKVLDGLHDNAWVLVGFGRWQVGWMPDGKSVYFISEKDGYLQLYAAPIDGTGARPLTSGKFEVFDPSLSNDKSRFFFTSSEVHPGEEHFYSMPVTGGARTRITSLTGSHRVLLSPDEQTAAVVYSYSNKPPELYLMDNRPEVPAKQITLTPTEEWRSFPWVDPRLITFKARDGAEVYARVYTPEMLKEVLGSAQAAPSRPASRRPGGAAVEKRPAVIFVHGAGYAQNAHKYWSSYYHEYMFHHILMDRGFVVMDMDYRGSSGYGRDWRTGIYRHMGGKDLHDQVDGARWMADNLNVDPKRIGIYGGSYGGFITLMAMFTQPGVFAAGAALRPVTDWAHYSHGYTVNILNQPQDDAEAYRQSSPIYLAGGLRGALLICHGVVDTNVHFQDTVRLAERLIELRKDNWELALFPVENHGFQRADSWTDEYKRILRLFETYLKPAR
jgi:dipeptidyl aminopeptidase/acylaminoacyl peptidase/uncharacterized GH25 family protein